MLREVQTSWRIWCLLEWRVGPVSLPPDGQEAPAGATARAAKDTPTAPYLTRQERPCSWTGSAGSLINFRQTRLLWDFML